MGRERTIFEWIIIGLGVFLIAVAILALGADAQASFEHAEPRFIPIGEYWYNWARGSYNGIQVFLERYVWPDWLGVWIWQNVMLNLIQWPVWVVSGPLGVLIFIFGFTKK